MQWLESDWETLNMDDWHDVLQLRINVFVVEQNCPYPELDGKDKQSFHLWARKAGGSGSAVAACVRLVPPGVSYDQPSIGRVATTKSQRGTGLGPQLMARALAACERHWPGQGVRISAQCYLDSFYGRLGFEPVGETYLEDDIPHIQMFRPSRTPQHLMDKLDSAKARWLEVFAQDGATSVQPEQGWNAGEILQHLLSTSVSVLGYLNKKCQANPEGLPALDSASDGRGLELLAFLESNEKKKAPAFMARPERRSTMEQHVAWISEWEKAHRGLRKQTEELDAHWWHVQVFNHPLSGGLSLADTIRFIEAHIGHHQGQLESLLKLHQ